MFEMSNKYTCWHLPSFKPLLANFEPNPPRGFVCTDNWSEPLLLLSKNEKNEFRAVICTIGSDCLYVGNWFQTWTYQHKRRWTGRNMDPSLHTRDQGTVGTVDFFYRSRRRTRCVRRPTRSGRQFFGMHASSCTSIILKGVERSPAHILQSCWIDSTPIWSKNDRIWRGKKCCSIKTMHGWTRVSLPWQNYMNWAMNCFSIHHIL